MKQHYFHQYGVRFAGWYFLLALCWLIAVHLWLEHVLVASLWLRLAVDVGFIAISALFASVMAGQLWRQIDVQLGLNRLSNRLHQLALNAPPSPYFEQEVCRLAVEEVGLRLAWIGLIDAVTQQVVPVARWGPAGDYVDIVQIRLNDAERSRGPTGTSLRLGKPVVSADIATDPRMQPWRDAALPRGLRSSVALPLHIDGRVIGTLNLYADQPNFFNDTVVNIGMLLAGNLARIIESRQRAVERDAAQTALQQSEARFHRLAEQAPDIIFRYILAPQPQLDLVNPAVRNILGYEPEQLRAQMPAFSAFIDQPQIEHVERLIAQGRGQILLHTRRSDGHYIWLDVRFVVVDQAIEGIARDVTAQVEAAARLARYELLSAHARDIVLFVRARDGQILEANAAAERAYGYSRAELCSRTIYDLRAPETRPVVRDQMAKANTQGILFETMHTRSDGSVFPVEVSSIGADIDGERVLLSVIRDISERKKAQAELDLLRTALNATAQAIVITDPNGVIEWANPAFTVLTGYPVAEALGQHTRLLRSGKHDRAFYAAMWAQILSGQTWHSELINRRKDGSLYHEEMTITPVRRDGVIEHFIAVKQDVSERVRREQKQALIERLGEAMRPAQTRSELALVLVQQLREIVSAEAVALWRKTSDEWQIEQVCGNAVRFNVIADRLPQWEQQWVGAPLLRQPAPADLSPQREVVVVPFRCVDCADNHCHAVATLIVASPISELTADLLAAAAERVGNALRRTELFEQVQRANDELRAAYDATIEGWARALDLRDHETEGHSRRVTELTVRIAERMGFAEEELVHIRRGALLHDIGKMGIPDAILNKPGPLDEREWAIMRTHPTLAVELLRPISFLAPALAIPWCHHEKWDGTGYPRGLRGEDIPLAARIFAVVDVYDALTSDRPYRAAWPRERALAYIREQAGSHFDPKVVEVFLALCAEDDHGRAMPIGEESNHA
ncbi:PAS domain S-box protein [Chloroflexus sp.]|uniref:PAS domain S-box protein n=1 Tax=Chloroflexus sp. TaxID=1904827 RepID=UPI00298EEC9B|nr:PAS domain S-box protein [Chloroflexus sp.]MDW8403331.1 PAS domain S-box protein [Chloroflexus sp.]